MTDVLEKFRTGEWQWPTSRSEKGRTCAQCGVFIPRGQIHPPIAAVAASAEGTGLTETGQPFGDEWSSRLSSIREHIAVERRAAQAAIPERGAFAEGQAAALLSLDQWLAYQEQR